MDGPVVQVLDRRRLRAQRPQPEQDRDRHEREGPEAVQHVRASQTDEVHGTPAPPAKDVHGTRA
jgi:hypothetical protein